MSYKWTFKKASEVLRKNISDRAAAGVEPEVEVDLSVQKIPQLDQSEWEGECLEMSSEKR